MRTSTYSIINIKIRLSLRFKFSTMKCIAKIIRGCINLKFLYASTVNLIFTWFKSLPLLIVTHFNGVIRIRGFCVHK